MQDVDFSNLPKKERRRLKRELERQVEAKKNRMAKIVKWSIVALLLLLVLLGGWFLLRDMNKPLPGNSVPDQGRTHVGRDEWETFAYNSNPPTSGPHDADWKRAGVYSAPVGDGHLVHSLEHGYIVISYNCGKEEEVSKVSNGETCSQFVDKLKQRVNKDSNKLILVPRPTLDTNFALTAWTRLDTFNTQEASVERVEEFIKAFRNKGPEKTME